MALASTESCPACGSVVTRILYQREYRDRRWGLARCGICRQHFTSPKPTDTDVQSFYTGEYHSALRSDGGTDVAFGDKYRRYADALARHLSSGRVVDVGCSTGLLVKMLRDR